MLLMLKDFLKQNSNWEELLSKPPYNLTIRHDDGRVLFKYNQYESDMSLRICQEARGIIFDEKTLEPICVPYFKFFNYGEELAVNIDWKTATVQEKIDGSLIKLYYWHGKWHVATNGTIDAYKAYVGDTSLEAITFGDLFYSALTVQPHTLYQILNPDYCYMLELIHPFSKVVIDYNKKGVYLHGIRDMKTLEEVEVNPADYPYGYFKFPKKYDVINLEETLELLKELNDGNHEGVVVCDAHFNRIKMKTEEYLAKARILNNGIFTTNRFIKMFLNDTLDDYIAYAPENKEKVEKYLKIIQTATEEIDKSAKVMDALVAIKNWNRKEIVSYIKTTFPENRLFFNYYMVYHDKKVSDAADYIINLQASQLKRIIENFYSDEEDE